MSEGNKLKEIQTVQQGWKKQAEKLCREFQLMGGEMIIVARQPNKQLFACCTSNAEEGMVKNFNTFKECLPVSQRSVKIPSGMIQSKPNNDKAKTTNETQIEKGKKFIATTSNKQENVIQETSISKTTKESLKRKILTGEKIGGKSQQENEKYHDVDLEDTEEPGQKKVSEKQDKTNTSKKSKTKTSNTAEKDKKSDAKNKPVLHGILAQSASEKTTDEGNEKNSQNGTVFKRIQTKKPSILSRQPITKTPKSEAASVCKASDIVIQISVTASKSPCTNTDTVSVSSKPVSQTSTVTSKIVLPIFLSSKEAIITPQVAGKDSGNSTAHTLTTSSFASPVVSTPASHAQKENSSAVESKEAQAKVVSQKGTSPNMNMVLLGTSNQLCLVQQPSKEGTVQLAANQVPIPQTKLLLPSSQPQSAQTTNSAPLQSGLILVPSSQTSIGTTYVAPMKATTTTPLKILPKGDQFAAQVKQTPKVLNDTTTPTSLPKVFILAAPNSMSSALKSNRTGYIVPMSATPNSMVSQASAASASLSNSTETSTATPKDKTSPASQILLSFIKKELKEPETGVEKTVNKEESSAKSQKKEKVSVPPLKENRLPVTMGSFVKIGNALYQLVVKDGQQLLIPTRQLLPNGQPVTTTSTDPRRTLTLPRPKKRKFEEGKDLDSGKRQKTSNALSLKTPTNVHEEKYAESESDPEEEDLSELNEMLERRKKSNESRQESASQAPLNQPKSSSKTQAHENEQGNSTNLKFNLNSLEAQDRDHGFSHPQPDPSILQEQENEHGHSQDAQQNAGTTQQQANDHGYSVQQVDIPPVLCSMCSFKASYWKSMADHMRHHGSKRYCIKCNNFMNSSKFNVHNCTRRGTNKNRKQICLICSRLASNAFELIKHYRVSHRTDIEKRCHSNSLYRSVRSQKIFVCKGCGTLEYTEQYMLSHVKKFHVCERNEYKEQQSPQFQKREPVCVCPVCFFHFPEKKHLNFHINLFHSGKRGDTIECSLCDSNFSCNDELFDHYTTHKPNIKYKCAICAQHKEPMNSLEEVQHHRDIIHPSNKLCALLLCPEPQCQETFQEDIDFVLHIIQHEIGTKYSHTCAKCDFSTSSESMLSKHESKFHYESEKRCHVCTKRFKLPENLTKHMEIHKTMLKSTNDTFICDRCGQIHTNISKHRRHMSKHREKDRKEEQPCKVCGEVFVSAQNVAKHMFKCHPEVEHDIQAPKYPCAYCDYVSLNRGDFRRHMSTHKRTNHFVCKICERGFKDKPGLRIHIRLHKQGRNNKKFRCFACHIDRDGSRMKVHLQTENHKMNCKLAGINLDDYNEDLLNLFPSKVEALKLPRKHVTPISYIDQCQKIHKKHCKRASLLMVEEKSYTVLTPDGDEIQLDMPSRNPKCEECGLLFKSFEDLEEHREHVRLLELSSNRNNFVCEVCDIHLFERIGVAKHATSKDHIEKCRIKGVDPEEILKKSNISKDVSSKKRKELPTHGYRCKVCDAYFASRTKKAVHIGKDIHVKKCQELGLDPAGDHFEDLTDQNSEEKLPSKERKKTSRIEKAINRRKMKLDSIELMGVKVPRLISFECLVCHVLLASRIQGIDHLNTTMHREKCSDLGIQSTPGNLTVKASDIQSVVGKSIPQLLGVATDTVFPISEREREVYVRQIAEAEMISKKFSNIKYRIVKIRPNSDDAQVVVAELQDEDLETSQQSIEVPQETTTAVVNCDAPQTFRAEEESSLDTAQEFSFISESMCNSVMSGTQVSVHQGHVVPTSVLSPKQSILKTPKATVKSTSSRKAISQKGDVLQPSSNQQTKYESFQEVEVESAMVVDQIFYEDVSEIEISENIDFETVSANELNHYDSF
ncbi:uncharacterized protein LOC133187391 [Saccostrea echinata]|uniref:uncharacterized protein LOC133187391 n=1 Tax=Saccostrea echinata TaxID=191078 RepID=UPI002A816EA7|nr:uncharacterized protein LOC133187391 [Saccostrea echinata]